VRDIARIQIEAPDLAHLVDVLCFGTLERAIPCTGNIEIDDATVTSAQEAVKCIV
jgi:hypothetical protein